MIRRRDTPKSLRRRLFVSHLLVMAVALGVLIVGMGLVVGLIDAVGERQVFGKGRQDEAGSIGLVVGLAAAAIAAAFVSWRVTNRLAAPLDSVRSATRRLAAGRYDTRVPGADTAELDALAADINTLASELDATEHRRLRLIGDVAHELRNPLSTIEGTMEALLDGVVAADDDTYARIAREAARLRRLADDLSSLSAAGELADLATEPVDLAAVAGDVVAQLEPQALAKGLRLELHAPSDLTIPGDRDRLTQVLMNVIGNAVQYTIEGDVRVDVARSGRSAVVEVADTGIGLAEGDQTRIFERFHRVDQHFTDGTGVGLAIAELVVAAHGGTIAASSPGLGAGTTIRVELPAR